MNRTRKITYCAVCAAVAVIAVVICAYTPANIVPLALLSVAFYIAFCTIGVWGLLSVAVTLIITFFMVGFRDSYVLALVLFTPYSVFAFLMRKIKYEGKKNCVIRAISAVMFFLTEAFVLLMLGGFLTGVDFMLVADKFGIWAVYVLFAVLSLPTDFFFVFAADRLLGALNKIAGRNRKQ